MRSRLRSFVELVFVLIFASSFSYQIALPGRGISLPRDHASHPEFKTEWWYYTGHLDTMGRQTYGYQVTFFRFGVRDRQKDENSKPLFTDLYMAHFALSDKRGKKFLFRERANRGYGDRAGASTGRYFVWNEDWKVEERERSHVIEIKDRGARLALRLTPLKPAVLHGDNGLSRKGEGEGRASHYYSLTRLQTEGELEIGGKTEKVRGLSWMDHEFGSDQLSEQQSGWDWFSIQLENGIDIMLYVIRRQDGSYDPYSSGTVIFPDGATRHLPLHEFQIAVLQTWRSPKSGGVYPIKWKVVIPALELDLQVVPFFPEQELATRKSTRVTYWEGAAVAGGTYRKKPIDGRAYVEMTGYVGKLKV